MTLYVVTGTDTGVGKTVVTAALATLLSDVAVIKPAQTGVAPDEPGDLDDVRRLAGEVRTVEGVRLPDPLAPDTAARISGIALPDLAAQRDLVLGEAAEHDHVLVEGAGGVMVRIGEGFTLLDLADALVDSGQAPEFVVVCRSGLGTLNHTQLTVDAITGRGHVVRGLVIGASPAEPDLAERHNVDDLPRVTGVRLLGAIPAGSGSLPGADFRGAVSGWLRLF